MYDPDKNMMQPHARLVEEIVAAGGTASYSQRAVALAEIDDGALPYLIVEVLGRDGRFKHIFEYHLLAPESLVELQLPVILRASMYGQPVGATTCSIDGNFLRGSKS